MGLLSKRRKLERPKVMGGKISRHDQALLKHGFIDERVLSRMTPRQREEYYYNIKRRVLQGVPEDYRGIASRMPLEDLLKFRARIASKEEKEFSNVEDRIIASNLVERKTRKHAEELEETGFKTKGLPPERINRVYYMEKEAFADAIIKEKGYPPELRDFMKEQLMGYTLRRLREEFMKVKKKK